MKWNFQNDVFCEMKDIRFLNCNFFFRGISVIYQNIAHHEMKSKLKSPWKWIMIQLKIEKENVISSWKHLNQNQNQKKNKKERKIKSKC